MKTDRAAMETLFPNAESRAVANRYLQYKQDPSRKSENMQLAQDFSKIYRNDFYAEIKKDKPSKAAQYFLEHAGIYSYLDSLFNYLRKPKDYPKQCARVIKIYYAALVSILNSMAEQLKDEAYPLIEMYQNMLAGKENSLPLQQCLSQIIEGFESAFITKIQRDPSDKIEHLYYYQMRKLADSTKHDLSLITTNYTTIAERIIGKDNCRFAYLHGKLNLFEELETKAIADITRVDLTNTVFPYLLVQSGVKPIISDHQIEEFYSACQMISTADELLIIGYGINPDDEHVTNFLRKRIRDGKKIKIFIYSSMRNDERWNESVHNIHDQLGDTNLVIFYHTSEFGKYINSLL